MFFQVVLNRNDWVAIFTAFIECLSENWANFFRFVQIIFSKVSIVSVSIIIFPHEESTLKIETYVLWMYGVVFLYAIVPTIVFKRTGTILVR